MSILKQTITAFCLMIAITVPGMAQATKARPPQQQAPTAKKPAVKSTANMPPECEDFNTGCVKVVNGKVVETFRTISCEQNEVLFKNDNGTFYLTFNPRKTPATFEAVHVGNDWYTPIGNWNNASGRGNAEENSPGTIVLTIPIAGKGFAIELPGMELITLKSDSLRIPEHLARAGTVVYIYKPAGDYLTCTIQDANDKQRVCQ